MMNLKKEEAKKLLKNEKLKQEIVEKISKNPKVTDEITDEIAETLANTIKGKNMTGYGLLKEVVSKDRVKNKIVEELKDRIIW